MGSGKARQTRSFLFGERLVVEYLWGDIATELKDIGFSSEIKKECADWRDDLFFLIECRIGPENLEELRQGFSVSLLEFYRVAKEQGLPPSTCHLVIAYFGFEYEDLENCTPEHRALVTIHIGRTMLDAARELEGEFQNLARHWFSKAAPFDKGRKIPKKESRFKRMLRNVFEHLLFVKLRGIRHPTAKEFSKAVIAECRKLENQDWLEFNEAEDKIEWCRKPKAPWEKCSIRQLRGNRLTYLKKDHPLEK